MGVQDAGGVDAVMWPDGPWPQVREEWRRAESWGVGRGWVWDHLLLGGRPVWHEAHTVLAAVAGATSRIGTGVMVTSPNFRHPLVSAKTALALDAVSEGRFVLGVGAGGPGTDSDALGAGPWTSAERAERFEEFTRLLDRALSEPRVDARGRWWSAVAADVGGGAPRRPPLAVAATGPRGMAVAARHADVWITQDVARAGARDGGAPRDAQVRVRRQVESLDRACRDAGRDPASVRRVLVVGYGVERPLDSVEAFADCRGRYADLGVDRLAVLWPRGERARAQLDVLAEVCAGPAAAQG